jgi:hypothetical protein
MQNCSILVISLKRVIFKCNFEIYDVERSIKANLALPLTAIYAFSEMFPPVRHDLKIKIHFLSYIKFLKVHSMYVSK